ncbi:nitrilase-related carbon-nitrogen hydrolase [Nitrospina watsonii]|uniref:Nitrilase n=1 Tax=Nitrospina watsonii TaxID=1323948 RepID=A0ABN8W4A8_9BACT|nr:nitrilase-related carbon-nitrogen hydrolase [Nitrospina watsonii]CAI2719640.1 Nitrilase [Nitrospina watsonii]
MKHPLKVGFLQTLPVFGDIESNLKQVELRLKTMNADLVVLPELFTTGYQFRNQAEARDLAEPIPDGPTTQALVQFSRQFNMHIVAGLAEKDGDILYNSAVLTGPEGYIGKYRKAHIFDTEKKIFAAGNLPLPVFDIGKARVGIMICFDWRFPETARTLALKGADLIAHPANLVLLTCPQSMITRCLENRVFAVTADRVGVEQRIEDETLRFIGQSQVVDPDGRVIVRASEDGEEDHVVEIDLADARNKSINPYNDLIADRREDLYKIL